MLRQDFDQRHAKRPNVASRRRRPIDSFRRVVSTPLSRRGQWLSNARNRVVRKFQPVSAREYIGWLQIGVDEAFAVKIFERIKNRA
jgi:hypothetical protein